MGRKLRFFHRHVAPWVGVLLVFLAVTGVIFRVGKSWFGLEKEQGWKILDLHAGEWLGGVGSVIYVLIAGVGALSIVTTGAWLALHSRTPQKLRAWHRVLGLCLLLPLAASAVTGMAYRIGEEFFGISEETQDVLMMIHQGSWLGSSGKVFYILLLGTGVLVLVATGWRMALHQRSKHPH